MSHGADTDYWAFADTNVKLISSNKTGGPQEAQGVDSENDVAESTLYDTIYNYECRYEAKPGALSFASHKAGKVISSKVVTGGGVQTRPDGWPLITLRGETCPSADSVVMKYDMADMAITAARKAIKIGATVDANSKLTGSNVEFSVQVHRLRDSNGISQALDVSKGRVTATNDFVGVSGAPGAAADTGWEVESGPTKSEVNTEYGTGQIVVFKNVAHD
jgi:hypothetical protein